MATKFIQYLGAGLNLSNPALTLIPDCCYEIDDPLYYFLKENYRYVIKHIAEDQKPPDAIFIKLEMSKAPMRSRPLTEFEEQEREEELAKKGHLEVEEKAKADLIEQEKAAPKKAGKQDNGKGKNKKKNVEKL